MKTFLFAAFLCLAFNANGLAEQSAGANIPPQEDLKAQIARTRQDLQSLADSISQQLQRNIRVDVENRLNAMAEDLKNAIRSDDLAQALAAIYQKHFSKEDLQAMADLQSKAARERILREVPAIAEETRQSVTPILRRQMEELNQRLQQELSELRKQLDTKPGHK